MAPTTILQSDLGAETKSFVMPLSYAAQYLSDKLRLERPPSGLHLVGWLPEAADEWEMAKLADREGVRVYPPSAFRLGAPGRRSLVLGFAAFGEVENAVIDMVVATSAGLQPAGHTFSFASLSSALE